MSQNDKIDELRKAMGTMPDMQVPLRTPIFRGVEGIKVELYDANVNPYKGMFNMVTSTWGKKIDKWPDVSPENRFKVVKAVLEFKALPGAMEHPTFCFGIERCSRSAFDQIARARIGAVFASQGWRDNDHSDIGFRVPEVVCEDPEAFSAVTDALDNCKRVYHKLVQTGQANWQDARSVLPISACHMFSMSINYLALRNFCNKRLKFCEQADTVAVAWLMRKRVLEAFPLLGSYLRPSCDGRGVCEYHQSYSLSEAFGCLFRSCGRNIDKDSDGYATFNSSCTDAKTLAKQLGIKIPGPKEELPPQRWEDLAESDRDLLCS